MDHALVIFTIKWANKKSPFEPVVFRMGAWSPPLPSPSLGRMMPTVWRYILLTAMLSKNLTLSQQINLDQCMHQGLQICQIWRILRQNCSDNTQNKPCRVELVTSRNRDYRP